MDKKILKFLVKREFAGWAPTLDAVYNAGKDLVVQSFGDDVDGKMDELARLVQECVVDCRARLRHVYEVFAFSTGTRKYVLKRFKKEFGQYASFFIGELAVKINVQVLTGFSAGKVTLLLMLEVIKPLLDVAPLFKLEQNFEVVRG
jgi:hypothetical protein